MSNPEEIYTLSTKLLNLTHNRAFEYQDSDADSDKKLFREIAEETDDVTQEIIEAIRTRVKEWEPLPS